MKPPDYHPHAELCRLCEKKIPSRDQLEARLATNAPPREPGDREPLITLLLGYCSAGCREHCAEHLRHATATYLATARAEVRR